MLNACELRKLREMSKIDNHDTILSCSFQLSPSPPAAGPVSGLGCSRTLHRQINCGGDTRPPEYGFQISQRVFTLPIT